MSTKRNQMPTLLAVKTKLKPGVPPHEYVILITAVDTETSELHCVELWQGKGFKTAISRATGARRGKNVLHKLQGITFNGFEVKCIDKTQGKEIYRKKSVSNELMRKYISGKI